MLSGTGVAVSAYLTYVHRRLRSEPGWESLCAISASLNCDTVITSPFGGGHLSRTSPRPRIRQFHRYGPGSRIVCIDQYKLEVRNAWAAGFLDTTKRHSSNCGRCQRGLATVTGKCRRPPVTYRWRLRHAHG